MCTYTYIPCDSMPKRPRPAEATSTYVKLELAGVSRHGAREIHEVIERVLQQERGARAAGAVAEEVEEAEDARDGATAVAPAASAAVAAGAGTAALPRAALIFEPDFVIDRVGVQSIPRDLQNPHTWEAWRIPTYELVVAAARKRAVGGGSAKTLNSSSSSSSSSGADVTGSAGKVARQFAPAGHTSRQARGRFHIYCPASRKTFVPGMLSPELRSALGMGNGEEDLDLPVPWMDRMRRYGYPPAFVIESLKGRLDKKVLKMLDGEDEEDEAESASVSLIVASESECVRKLLEFPLYLCPGADLTHPGFAALRRGDAAANLNAEEAISHQEGGGGGLLRVSPCPIG